MSQFASEGPNGQPPAVDGVHDGALEDRLELFMHDVRTPLTVVHGALKTLARVGDDVDPAARRELLDSAILHAELIQELLAGYEQYRLLATGRLPVSRSPVDVADLVAELVDTEEAGIDVALDLSEVTADIDPRLTRQALRHLIDNVAMHTPLASTASIRTEAETPGVLITVEDDGPGVPAELRDLIFEPFERGIAPRFRSGIGLGLSVVREIAHLHGGAVWVEDAPGAGARFRLLLR